MGELYSGSQSLPYIASKKLIAVSPCKESWKGLGVCFIFSSIDWKHALYTFSRVWKIITWSFAICTCKKDTSKVSLIWFFATKEGTVCILWFNSPMSNLIHNFKQCNGNRMIFLTQLCLLLGGTYKYWALYLLQLFQCNFAVMVRDGAEQPHTRTEQVQTRL